MPVMDEGRVHLWGVRPLSSFEAAAVCCKSPKMQQNVTACIVSMQFGRLRESFSSIGDPSYNPYHPSTSRGQLGGAVLRVQPKPTVQPTKALPPTKDSAMKHGHFSRNSAKAFFAFAALALVGACADSSSVAPVSEAPAFVAPANFLRTGYVVAFRVDNAKGITQKIQDNVINIPANAICDLAKSGYGTTTWDKSCTPMKGSVVITATVLEGLDGEPYIDFQPAMRFAPNKEVTLFFKDKKEGEKNLTVKYCNNLGFCSDESLNDASLRPFRISKSIVGRRVKHFSGYVVAYENGLINVSISLLRKSGYMVASGEDITDIMEPKHERKDRTE
jgi:hypothetical protein